MRVIVDFELCESNAVCTGVAPKVFQMQGNDTMRVLDEHPSEELRWKIEEAVRRCPRQAISIEEDSTK